MKSLIKNRHGQFVVIAALIIAVLTLATIISVYEISVSSQTIAYKPVDEFLLGVTSDMNRALTVALSKTSTNLVNGQTQDSSDAVGQGFMDNWQHSLFTAYPNYGFKFNQPVATSFKCDWNRNPGYSSALTTYDFDVAAYGFMGWEGQTVKHVQLQLLTVSRADSTHTNLTFQLTQSVVNSEVTVGIADLPSNPDASTFKVGAYLDGQQFTPAAAAIVTYHGSGVYSAVFNQPRDLTKGIKLELMIPNDGIWVSAMLLPDEGSTDQPVSPALTTTPPSNAVANLAFHDTATLTGATSDASGTVTYTLYSGVPGSGVQIGLPSTVNVANGQVPNSALYSAFTAGQYYFMAYYSGDLNNNAVIGSPEQFTVKEITVNPPNPSNSPNPSSSVTPSNSPNPSNTPNPPNGKLNPAILTTQPGAVNGLPSTGLTVTAPIYSQTSYSVNIQQPSSSNVYGLWAGTYESYYIGQIPIRLYNNSASYQTVAYCMNFNKDLVIGSTNAATLTPVVDNSTWRSVAYLLSWINPANDTEGAVEQVAVWKLIDSSYQKPSWITTAIDNQASAWANSAIGKDVVRQGDVLKWISPVNGNTSSVTLTPGSTVTFTGQLTASNGSPRANVKMLFNANLTAAGQNLQLNSTYVTPSSAYTDSQGQIQVTVKVPKDTPTGASINIQASTCSNWPRSYVNLNSAQYQDLLVAGPVLNLNLATSILGGINVGSAAYTGVPFNDKATVIGATNDATGTVTYTLYSGIYPAGSEVGVSQVQVASGAVPNSDPFTVSTPGAYYFLAAYSGDDKNNPALGAPEPFTVTANMALTTTPPSGAIAGTPFFDKATLSGASADAAGTVTYVLYKGTYPSGTAIGTSTVSVANGAVPNSASFTVSSVGAYYFIAQYSGDGGNNAVNGGVEAFNVAMPAYSGIPIYYCSTNTQNPWLDSAPPTISDKINSYLSNGQTTSTVAALTGVYRNVVVANKVNATLYIGTSQVISKLTIEVGFTYQNTYHTVGSATIYNIPKSSANKPYTATITIDVNSQVFVAGYPPLTIPQGSIISVTTTAPNYNGRITLYYGPGQLSQIDL